MKLFFPVRGIDDLCLDSVVVIHIAKIHSFPDISCRSPEKDVLVMAKGDLGFTLPHWMVLLKHIYLENLKKMQKIIINIDHHYVNLVVQQYTKSMLAQNIKYS